MKTWAERHKLPGHGLDFENPEGVDKKTTREVTSYETISSELEALRMVDRAIPRGALVKDSTPLPIPSRTGLSYEKWQEDEAKRSALNKAKTCLSMRVSQREKPTHVPQTRNTKEKPMFAGGKRK